jgi:hypothetical protein
VTARHIRAGERTGRRGPWPDPNMIFVFGSNLAGRHGKGAALYARNHFGAVTGVGKGPTGQAYAIPTKDERLEVLPLREIGLYVAAFLAWADENPKLEFRVTPVGCGLAGYTPAQIAPLFKDPPANVILPPEFTTVLKRLK